MRNRTFVFSVFRVFAVTFGLAAGVFTGLSITFASTAHADEQLHRLGGYLEKAGTKYAVCISLLENLWAARGVRAFSGSMTYAVSYMNGAPMSPPGFALAGNQSRGTTGELILSVFDQNNASLTNPNLMLRPTGYELRGKDLVSLQMIHDGETTDLHLRELRADEPCSLAPPSES